MSTPWSPDGTDPTFPFDLVNDGEEYNFTSIQVGLFKKLINKLGYLIARGPAVGATVTRVVSALGVDVGTTAWGLDVYPGIPATSAATVATWEVIIPECDLPNGATLKYGTAVIRPSSGRGSLSGLTMPIVTLGYYTPGSVTTTVSSGENVLATISDTSNLAAYETGHEVSTTPVTHVVDRTANRYFIRIATEHGTNAQAVTALLGMKVTYIAA